MISAWYFERQADGVEDDQHRHQPGFGNPRRTDRGQGGGDGDDHLIRERRGPCPRN